ncbi:hypothetical protein C8R43DRAFT_1004636 [Mycena crocata]|nr:hypothetical protein C8R43DRAFT_1004636 [Mycena crocata]
MGSVFWLHDIVLSIQHPRSRYMHTPQLNFQYGFFISIFLLLTCIYFLALRHPRSPRCSYTSPCWFRVPRPVWTFLVQSCVRSTPWNFCVFHWHLVVLRTDSHPCVPVKDWKSSGPKDSVKSQNGQVPRQVRTPGPPKVRISYQQVNASE